MASGVPGRRVPGLWDTACQCCGLAGLVELFAALWAVTGRAAYLDFAARLGGHLAARGSGDGRADGGGGEGLRWYQAYRRMILLPDNPFPALLA